MLLNIEELLALANGDAEPDRLADLLDRLENCPESKASLNVLVSLRANREDALEALRLAAEKDLTSTPFARPAVELATSTSWGGMQALRLAASVAIVGVLGVFAANSYFGSNETFRTRSLATTVAEYQVDTVVKPEFWGVDVELTSTEDRRNDVIDEAYVALVNRDFNLVAQLLANESVDDFGSVPLYLGTAYYYMGKYEQALPQFAKLRRIDDATPTRLHLAAWYEANALLALNSPTRAMASLEEARAQEGYPFAERADEIYDALAAALNWTVTPR